MSAKSTSVELAGLTPAQTASLISLCGAEIGKCGISALAGQIILEDGWLLKRPLAAELNRLTKRLVCVWPTNLTLRLDEPLYDLIRETGWESWDLHNPASVISREKLYPPDPEEKWDYYLVGISNRRSPREQSKVLERFGFRGGTIRELVSWLLTCKNAERIIQRAFSRNTSIVASGDIWGWGGLTEGFSATLGKFYGDPDEKTLHVSREIHGSSLESLDSPAIHLCARSRTV